MAIELPDGRCEPNDVLDALRLRAVHARELGYAVVDIAAILGVREETVSRWCSRDHRGGREALPGDRTGRPIGSGRLLDGEQEQGIRQAIETKTPQELAIASALWTRQAVRELIRQRVGIRLPIRTVGEYLRRWGYTPQKPVPKAYKQGCSVFKCETGRKGPSTRGRSGGSARSTNRSLPTPDSSRGSDDSTDCRLT